MMAETRLGIIVGIAIRTGVKQPMQELAEVEATEAGGLTGDNPARPHRGITLISQPQWGDVQADLGADLPWHMRRANLLVDASGLLDWIDGDLRIGQVELHVNAETKPCGLMDQIHQGLRAVLVADGRAGVYGQVTKGGTIRVGDDIVRL